MESRRFCMLSWCTSCKWSLSRTKRVDLRPLHTALQFQAEQAENKTDYSKREALYRGNSG